LRDHTRRAFRGVLWLIALFYAAFAPLDLIATPEHLIPSFWLMRGLVVAVSVASLGLSRTELFARHAAAVSALYLLVVPCGSLTFMVALLDGTTAIVTGGLAMGLVSLGAAILFVWPLRVALPTHATILALFLATHLGDFAPELWPVVVPTTFFVVMSGTVATLAQWLHLRSRLAQVEAQVRVVRLERAQREARQILARQAAELERANSRLRELDRMKSEFFANVSHELRTPLTLILAALDRVAESDDPVVAEPARMGRRSASRLLLLINDLLDLARLDAAREAPRPATVDLGAIVTDVASAFARADGGAPRVHAAREPLLVAGDSHLLTSVVWNLVSNAMKFTDRSKPQVEVRLLRRDGSVVLEVKDDGIGIARADHERIFERFSQVERGTSRRFEGTGIGLALVREVVLAHGGKVQVESEPGCGSLFRVALPEADGDAAVMLLDDAARSLFWQAAANDPEGASPPRELPDPGPRAPRALVVEDNAEMRAYVASVLAREYRVETAADVRATRPDLVVTDEMMPGMSGGDLLRAIREEPELSMVPVVFVTARSDPESRLALLEAGADDLLVKPFSDGELLARSRRLVLAATGARKLADANRDLELFASTAAHDLQAPVRSIAGFAMHLRRELGPKLDGQAATWLGYVEDGARRLTELIRGLLELARVSVDSGEATHQPVDLGRLLEEVKQDLANDMVHRNATIQATPLPIVSGHGAQLRLLLQNLVSNALKFHRPGEAPSVRLSAQLSTDKVVLSVADDGIGFAPKDAERIFDPLTRLHGVAQYPGTGLGLAICRRVVERHGGTISASSSPGQGATFTVVLPAHRALAAA
jgi:signal transduction histidine kinase